jgi:hypothetical protein
MSLLVAACLVFWEPPALIVFSASLVSVSMSVVLRGAKKLQVNTDFGGSLTVVDVGTGLVAFLALCEELLELYSCVSLFHGSCPGPLSPLRFCFLHHFVLPVPPPSGRPSGHSALPCTS